MSDKTVETEKQEQLTDIEELARNLLEKNYEKLRKTRFHLIIRLLMGRREYRLIRIEELELLATHVLKLEISGEEFINSATAIELHGGFISTETASLEEWMAFIESIKTKKHPRILVNISFRSRYGLPQSISDFDVFVVNYEILA